MRRSERRCSGSETALKGTAAGTNLDVDNRTLGTDFACSPYDEPFHAGYRFAVSDEPWLVILEKNVDGLWQLAFNGVTAWPLPDDPSAPLWAYGSGYGKVREPGYATLAVIAASAGHEGELPTRAGSTASPPGTTTGGRPPVTSVPISSAADDDNRAVAVTVVVALLAGGGVLGFATRRGVRRGSGR